MFRDRQAATEHSRPSVTQSLPWCALLALVVVGSALFLAGSPDEKQVYVYSSVANYSLPVAQHGGIDYVGLLETIEPLGAVSAKATGNHWRLRYNDVECEFTAGNPHARIRGSDLDLPAPFLLENGRGLVPVSGLGILLPRILGGPITFNPGARRLFVGNVAVHFTAQVTRTTPPKLVMNFTAPVNPTIATEPGRLRMTFTHEAVVAPGSHALTFDSQVIPSATFQENNGAAEVVVNATIPVMASFSNDGRTITIAAPAVPATAAQTPTPPASTLPPPSPPSASASALIPAEKHYFAVVDAAHGGDERGAALSSQLAEKDVTLAFARHLRQELDARGLTTLLVRDSDVTLTADQRAGMSNAADPAIYISLHATSEGKGVRVYTALTPSPGDSHGPFLDWDTAQTAFQARSQIAESGVIAELRNRQVAVRTLIAPLRPLNNLTAAAIAIEVAAPADDVARLNDAAYQDLIAGAIATGVADVRDKLQAGHR